MKSLFLMDKAGKSFPRTEKLLYFLVGALIISFFLPDMPVVGNIVIGAMMLLSFFYNSGVEKRQLLRERREIIMMLLFYLLHIISAFISTNRQEGMEMLVLRLPLLIFPLCIGLIYVRAELLDRMLLLFCLLTTGMALLCLGYSIDRSIRLKESAFLYDDSLTEIIHRQSVYIAQVVNLALFCYAYLLVKRSNILKYAWAAYASIAFLLIFHFMLASRIAIITLYSGMLVLAIFYIVKKRKFVQGLAWILSVALGAFLLVQLFPKTLNRFRELKYPEYSYTSHGMESHYNMQVKPDQWNGANIRLAVWKCGWELAGKHLLTGVPLGDKEDKLVEVFKSRQFDFAAQSRRNMHNTYLDVLCNFGVIGFGIFLLGYLFLPLKRSLESGDVLSLFIILSFAAAMITETWLDASFGCILLAFFLSLISATRKRKNVV